MKKHKNLILLLLLQILMIVVSMYAIHIYFSVQFDALDNMWPFARYYFNTYHDKIIFFFLSFTTLLLSIFLKNILLQKRARFYMTFINYLIKGIIAIALIDALSSMYTVLNLNTFAAHLPIGVFTIIISLLSTASILVLTIREVFTKKT